MAGRITIKKLSEREYDVIGQWARNGLLDKEIAERIGITADTLSVWKRKNEHLRTVLSTNRDISDAAAESALFKRVLGYPATETIEELDPDTGKLRVTKRITKHIPPDTSAIQFYLKNRRPMEWRDRRELEVSGAVPVVLMDDIQTIDVLPQEDICSVETDNKNKR